MIGEPNYAIGCVNCECPVTALVIGSYKLPRIDPEDLDVMFSLVKCPTCSGPHLVRHDTARMVKTREEWWELPAVVYPARPSILDDAVPEPVLRSYWEAERTLTEARAYVGTALLCRRTLEVICDHFGARKGNLASKLKALKEQGTIENRLYEWADKILRLLGNEAAHDVRSDISKEDAEDALEFTRAIIEYLYVFEAAYRRFEKRRADGLLDRMEAPD